MGVGVTIFGNYIKKTISLKEMSAFALLVKLKDLAHVIAKGGHHAVW